MPKAIVRLELGRNSRRQSSIQPVPSFLAQFSRQLRAYARGQRVTWRVPLSLTTGTPFQRKVWRALRGIPHGETRSYAWVAGKIGRPHAVRAVGAACGANPVPIIIPCHRVVYTNGSLGGFSAGLSWKRRLLHLERTKICSPRHHNE
ncbi:MAG: methylated-DNA--[protein]-cysteine S-methyltransferase [Verrucomicrobiia bacterium]